MSSTSHDSYSVYRFISTHCHNWLTGISESEQQHCQFVLSTLYAMKKISVINKITESDIYALNMDLQKCMSH